MDKTELILVCLVFFLGGSLIGWQGDYSVIIAVAIILLCIYGGIKLDVGMN